MEVLSEVMHFQMSPVVLDCPTIAVAVKYPFKNKFSTGGLGDYVDKVINF